MEIIVSTLARVSRVLYLSYREDILYISNRKTLAKVARVDRLRFLETVSN